MASFSAKTSAALTMRSVGGAKRASWKSSTGGGATGTVVQAASNEIPTATTLRMGCEIVCFADVPPKRNEGAPRRRQARARLLDGARRAAGHRAPRPLRLRLPAARPGARLRRALRPASLPAGDGGDAPLHLDRAGAVERRELSQAGARGRRQGRDGAQRRAGRGRPGGGRRPPLSPD